MNSQQHTDLQKYPLQSGAQGFPGGASGNLPANAGGTEDMDSSPGLGPSLGEGNGYPLQYSCLQNSMDRGVWWVTVHGVTESDITK